VHATFQDNQSKSPGIAYRARGSFGGSGGHAGRLLV
jgi:hypothetical protein